MTSRLGTGMSLTFFTVIPKSDLIDRSLLVLHITEQTECYALSPVVGIGTPHSLTRRRACPTPPPPLVGGGWGRYTLACGRGGGAVPILTRGQTLWYSWYICTLFYICLFYGRSRLNTCLLFQMQTDDWTCCSCPHHPPMDRVIHRDKSPFMH